jgi:hypothetical protein
LTFDQIFLFELLIIVTKVAENNKIHRRKRDQILSFSNSKQLKAGEGRTEKTREVFCYVRFRNMQITFIIYQGECEENDFLEISKRKLQLLANNTMLIVGVAQENDWE